jgi:arginine repressor
MTIWDDRILEIIREDESGTSTELAKRDEIHIAQSTVSRRLQKLSDYKLLRPLGNGVYILTDEGEAYLDGEYDAEKERYINGGGSSNDESSAADGPGINS